MAAQTTARKVLWPADSRIVLRVCFLHVGQGSSILVLARDGSDYKTLLIDSNQDQEAGGIDLAAMLQDLLPEGKMYAFVNTHPHNDHLKGLEEIKKAMTIENVWHSGFEPSKKHEGQYKHLTDLIKDVKKRGGKETELRGSRDLQTLFDVDMYTLAPADHVKEDIDDKEGDARDNYIHEYCAVLRFGKKKDATENWILVTGDADLVAFQEHITEYHKERLPSYVLDASHHGSRSFFKKDEEADPYMEALNAINPTYVTVSAPTTDESRFDHPHDDAMKLYRDKVGKDKVFHTGKDRESFIFDIYEDGKGGKPISDEGELAQEYGLDKSKDEKEESRKASGPFESPKDPAEGNPRKYA